jgi:hypothetical protein
LRVDRVDSGPPPGAKEDVFQLTNVSDSVVDTHLLIIVRGLPQDVRLENASGVTHDGEPYVRVFLKDGVLQPAEQITQRLVFSDATERGLPAYEMTLLSGQGMP